ncbi:M23 family metallopeptidase [Nocardioides jensenii]|uniref:M23 family metallopeptidase n=1 Tax=Nocardioides jensenii TaxID=1843 RepID=UPI00082CED1A|nr:M23 family metallopeptidase [Nocardioides jensenii]
MLDLLQRQATHLLLGGLVVSVGLAVADDVTDLPSWTGPVRLGATAVVVLALALVFLFPGGDLDGDPIVVASPVRGRWMAMNSPATKVPSHGIRSYGQAFAIDLVHEPHDGPARPQFGTGPGMSSPRGYPAFGQPVRAMIGGTVVRVRDRQRDHLTRTRWWAVAFMMLEGVFRELRGSSGVVGNHVVIDRGDGVYALVAHLRRGSAGVRVGDRVAVGDPIGACGNSGNTSEPHVHAQLMDRARASVARGVPMAFADVELEGGGGKVSAGLPENNRHLVSPGVS